jgi:arsenite methyltransferase
MLEDAGFTDVVIGPAVDTFGGAPGEPNARTFEVFGHAFLARRA